MNASILVQAVILPMWVYHATEHLMVVCLPCKSVHMHKCVCVFHECKSYSLHVSISCHWSVYLSDDVSRATMEWQTLKQLSTFHKSSSTHTLVSQRNRGQGSHSTETPSNSQYIENVQILFTMLANDACRNSPTTTTSWVHGWMNIWYKQSCEIRLIIKDSLLPVTGPER